MIPGRGTKMKRLDVVALLALITIGGSQPTGTAQSAECTPSGGLTLLCGIQAPEARVLVPNTRWLLASGMAPGSGLHLVDTRTKTVRNLYPANASGSLPDRTRYPSCPGTLDPKLAVLHGLSLRPASNGRYTVYATNHGGRESIEVFELATGGGVPTATWIGCVLMPNDIPANSVAAFKDGSLVATALILPGKSFEDAFAGRDTGAVFLWTPGDISFRMLPGPELSANNGIETSPDDKEFYVVSTTQKRIVAFSRDNPEKPLRTAQLAEFGPDNVRWTSDKRLITAGMIDNEPACGGPPKTEARIRCSGGQLAGTS